MEKYVIIADSTSDLSPELRQRFCVEEYTPGFIHISDGRDFRSTLDWSEISREDFYSLVKSTFNSEEEN